MTYIFFESHLIIPWSYTHLQKYITTCHIWGINNMNRESGAHWRHEMNKKQTCDNFHHLSYLTEYKCMVILNKIKTMPHNAGESVHNAVLIAHYFELHTL